MTSDEYSLKDEDDGEEDNQTKAPLVLNDVCEIQPSAPRLPTVGLASEAALHGFGRCRSCVAGVDPDATVLLEDLAQSPRVKQ